MQKRRLPVFIGMILLLVFSVTAQENGTWVFAPDSERIYEKALLDLRFLNENVAGEKGWMITRDGEFYLPGATQPWRGWSAGLRPFGVPYEMDQLKQTARLYSRLGINQVREMADANIELLQFANGEDITKIDLDNLDKVHRLVAAMKAEGIYTTFCPWWFHRFKIENHPQVPGAVRHGKVFYWSRDLRDLIKGWYRQILTTENPYTGLSMAEDPAVNIFELQNEQNMLFWGLGPNICDAERWDDLGRQFTEWVTKKYGTLEKAENAWGFDAAAQAQYVETVDGQRRLIAPQTAWWWPVFASDREIEHPLFLADALEFVVWLERDFVTEMSTFIKEELGYGGMVSGGNWRAPFGSMEDLSTWCKIAPPAQVANYHVYINFGMESPQSPGTASYKVSNGSYYRSGSILADPRKVPTNFRHYRGVPTIATEMGLPFPNDNNLEGIITAAAYGALTGLDQITWLQIQFEDYGYKVQGANRFNYNWPHLLGQFPAAALLYRRGYVDTVDPVVIEKRSLQSAYTAEKPSILPVQSKDPLYSTPGEQEETDQSALMKPFEGEGVDPLAFLKGPVAFEFTEDAESSIEIDPSVKNIQRESGMVASANGQLKMMYASRTLLVDTPEAFGVIGAPGKHQQDIVSIETRNRLSSVLVISLDGKPLSDSGRLLVQAVTPSHLSGEEVVTLQEAVTVQPKNQDKKVEIPAGAQYLKNYGRLPFVIENVEAKVTFSGAPFSKATVLDPYGVALEGASAELKELDGKQELVLHRSAYYTILER